MKSVIYKITNLVNNKIYIGSAKTHNTRRNQHFSALKLNYHSNPHLQNAVNKYGLENFTFEILEYCPEENLIKRETEIVHELDARNPNIGYNILDPTNNRLGLKHSEESKLKMKESALKYFRLNGSRKHSKETKQKMSEAAKGKTISEETRKKFYDRMRGKNIGKDNPFYGKTHTKETIDKIKQTNGWIKNYKKISKFDLDGNFIKTFNSLEEAKKSIGVTSNGGISEALNNFNRTCKGFKWKYFSELPQSSLMSQADYVKYSS